MTGRRYTIDEIADALKATNGLVSLAAKRLGCAASTIYKRLQKSPTLREVQRQARAELVDLAEAKLRQAILDGQPWAIGLVLKTLGKERGYTERQELALAGGDVEVELVWRSAKVEG